jgi:hypothetical protein
VVYLHFMNVNNINHISPVLKQPLIIQWYIERINSLFVIMASHAKKLRAQHYQSGKPLLLKQQFRIKQIK